MTDLEQYQFHYKDHLRLDQILSAQVPLTEHPEEIFFIIIHQAYELWFKTLILDLERAIVCLKNDDLAQAIWLLRRAGRIMDVADKQLDVLVMMPPAEFHAFRTKLGEASGLQSRQFRKIEVLGGLGETAGEEYAKRVEAQWPGLQAEVDMTLHRALLETVERHQVTVFDIYRNHWQHFTLFSLAEASIELDAKVLIWRQNHIKMVERMIGQRARGTGGTYGTRYLTNTTHYHFFPELWEVRNTLTAAGGGHVYSG